MPPTVISIENLSKSYQLGTISTGVFFRDLERWWAKKRGKPDPFRKIGEIDHGNRQDETIWALKDINFTVQQGEALGIIGRNGAGKSTLLKILSQVTAPTSGVVKVKGRIASLLEVGTGFHNELTGRENIYLNGAINGMTRAEVKRKFDEIVDFSGVEEYIDTPVKRYSSGMYVRLAFAVAAHLDPEILIVDEVLAVGDAEFQKKCLGKMGDVAHEGRTILFVSHNLEAVNQLCSRALLIDKGHLEYEGNQKKVIEYYLNNVSTDRARVIDMSGKKRHDAVIRSSFQITEIRFLGGNDQVVYKIGEPLEIEISYQFQAKIPELRVGIGINTSMNQRLCSFVSNPEFNLTFQKKNVINLIVDTNSFKPGVYYIDVWARPLNGAYDDAHESVGNAASFEISPIKLSGESDNPLNHGLVSIKHSFFINPTQKATTHDKRKPY
jgi:lipopolysaccharide transport system ATP-binding protein